MLNLLHFVMIQVASLQEERQSLVLDRDKLEERLAMAESLEDLRCLLLWNIFILLRQAF